jgi:hypothetical protein
MAIAESLSRRVLHHPLLFIFLGANVPFGGNLPGRTSNFSPCKIYRRVRRHALSVLVYRSGAQGDKSLLNKIPFYGTLCTHLITPAESRPRRFGFKKFLRNNLRDASHVR